MKKKIFLATLFMALISSSFAQTKFKEGYYINNANQKTTCLIKNSDWKNNPTTFKYRLTEDSEIKIASISWIKEFGISNADKYKRFVLDIDRSSNLTNKVSLHKEPNFKSETLFLKVLVEGNANLYSYESTNLKRYFFNSENNPIQQLVYKKYLAKNTRIASNNHYKQQLSNKLKCEDFDIERFKNIKYEHKALRALFMDFNQCGMKKVNHLENKKTNKFNLRIRPGINSTSLTVTDRSSEEIINFGNNISFRVGLELEYIFPFYNNKWSVFVEPSFNYFNSSEGSYFENMVEADMKSIDIPIGLRHYFLINEDSKIFVNMAYVTSFGLNSILDFEHELRPNLETAPISGNVALGLGYEYKKYNIEFQYCTPKNLFYPWLSDYNRMTLVIGYNIF